MEFTRKNLKQIFESADIDVPKDVLGQLCDLHTSSTEEITDALKETKAKLSTAEQERDELKTKAPKDGAETVSKEEYEKIKTDFDNYKAEVENKETFGAKEHALRGILKARHISEKRHDAIVKASKSIIEKIELDENKKAKNEEEISQEVDDLWGMFAETTETRGANTANPPANSPTNEDLGKLSMADYISARQKQN